MVDKNHVVIVSRDIVFLLRNKRKVIKQYKRFFDAESTISEENESENNLINDERLVPDETIEEEVHEEIQEENQEKKQSKF